MACSTAYRVSESQMDRQSLERFGQEAVALLQDGNFPALAGRFGYALAHGREPAHAIEADLATAPSDGLGSPENIAPSIVVKYFSGAAAESAGLVAAVECIAHLKDGSAVLLALVVTSRGSERCITLEGIDRVR